MSFREFKLPASYAEISRDIVKGTVINPRTPRRAPQSRLGSQRASLFPNYFKSRRKFRGSRERSDYLDAHGSRERSRCATPAARISTRRETLKLSRACTGTQRPTIRAQFMSLYRANTTVCNNVPGSLHSAFPRGEIYASNARTSFKNLK